VVVGVVPQGEDLNVSDISLIDDSFRKSTGRDLLPQHGTALGIVIVVIDRHR